MDSNDLNNKLFVTVIGSNVLVSLVSIVYYKVLQYFNVSVPISFQILVTEVTKRYYLKVTVAEEELEKIAYGMAESILSSQVVSLPGKSVIHPEVSSL